MLLTNKYGFNFKPGVSQSKVTEKVDYEHSLFRLVRRAWREKLGKNREKWTRELLGARNTLDVPSERETTLKVIPLK